MYRRATTLVKTNVYVDGTIEFGIRGVVVLDMTFVTDRIRISRAYGVAEYGGVVALWPNGQNDGSKARSAGREVIIFSDFSVIGFFGFHP